MPDNCSVYGCYNTGRKTRGTGIRYFRFPKENTLRQRWIHLCCRADKINANNAVICSVHFVGSDYKDDMKSRLLGIDPPVRQRALKENAVPSLFLPKGMLCYSVGLGL